MVSLLVIFVSCLLFLPKGISALDLFPYNISEFSYISSISVISNRAFLTLPKSSCFNNNDNENLPSLIEVPFQKSSDFFTNSIPRFNLNLEDYQGSPTNCYQIQDAIFAVADKFLSRLWVLDKGNSNCPPKIFMCHLFYKNYQVYPIPDFQNAIPAFENRLFSLILHKSDHLLIGFEDMNRLLVFSIKDNQWWILDLVCDEYDVSTQFLALSPKNTTCLYLTGGAQREIFTLNLKSALAGKNSTIRVAKAGEKLGNSSGLITDFKDGLSYYLTRDYAVIRWDTRRPSTAESVSVLGQSFRVLPYVSQLFTGPQFGVWALVNPGPYRTENCSEFEGITVKEEDRVTKLLKYNNF